MGGCAAACHGEVGAWDDSKAELAQATLSAMTCPFTANDFPISNDAVADAVARIQAGAKDLTPD